MYKSMPHSPLSAQRIGAENTALIPPPRPSLLAIAETAEGRLADLHTLLDRFETALSRLTTYVSPNMKTDNPTPIPANPNLLTTLEIVNDRTRFACERLSMLVNILESTV